jgi:flagellin-like hook-associated protein FlgL
MRASTACNQKGIAMSSSITLSAGIRQNLLSLQDTAANLTTTQEHLSTGKKVNTAFDNPTSYFQSQSLNNRANDSAPCSIRSARRNRRSTPPITASPV